MSGTWAKEVVSRSYTSYKSNLHGQNHPGSAEYRLQLPVLTQERAGAA